MQNQFVLSEPAGQRLARGIVETPLRITLLGAPQAVADGQMLPLVRRQLRALLYRLAASQQPVPRDQLCFLLWPDSPEAVARRNLTVLLTQLRRALPQSELLVMTGDAIGFDRAFVDVDTVAFGTLVSQAQRDGQVEPLAEAVALYRGPFLEGFSLSGAEFDSWVDLERQVWERRYLDTLAALVEGYAAQGDYPRAIKAAQQVLAVDELTEAMHRWLIKLYALSGDRSGALRQFEQCVIALDRELGVSPLPETRAVYDAVRDGALVLKPHSGVHQLERGSTVSPTQAELGSTTSKRLVQLPVAPMGLIGRHEELAYASALLIDPNVRLLTLCGPGGSGKTRLGLQVAWDVADLFADGAVFVALAAIRDPALVMQVIASACGLKQATEQVLLDHLRDKQLLLVLDNCEHLLAASPQIAALLAAAPGLCVLATSRAQLNLQGEHTFPVPPLPLPDLANLPPLDALADVPAVTLLLARTQALNPRFQLSTDNAADLAAICVRLDGLPLAIELAAARLKLLAPRDLLRRLDRRLAVLNNGPRDLPDRQQTLRATIDWSYRLLDTDEQVWFERCSVFVGGWTLAAAEGLHERLRWPGEVASEPLDALASLADKSLIHVSTTADGETRFTMLETIREFAAERLQERGAFEVVAEAHARSYAALFEAADDKATDYLVKIEHDHNNLRMMLQWFLGQPDEIETLLKLAAKLGKFWYWRNYNSEGRWWLEQVLVRTEQVRSTGRIRVLYTAGLICGALTDFPRGISLHEQALQLCTELGTVEMRSASLGALGILLCRQGNFARAVAVMEEGVVIARQMNSPKSLCSALLNLGGVLVDEGRDIPRAIEMYEEGRQLARQTDQTVIEAMALAAQGMAHALLGDYGRANAALEQGLRIQRQAQATLWLVWSLQYFGITEFLQGRDDTALAALAESLSYAGNASDHNSIPTSLECVAGILARRKQPAHAARLFGIAEAIREQVAIMIPPVELPLRTRILEYVRAQLPETVLREAWAAGHKLNLEQAVAEAKALTA